MPAERRELFLLEIYVIGLRNLLNILDLCARAHIEKAFEFWKRNLNDILGNTYVLGIESVRQCHTEIEI